MDTDYLHLEKQTILRVSILLSNFIRRYTIFVDKCMVPCITVFKVSNVRLYSWHTSIDDNRLFTGWGPIKRRFFRTKRFSTKVHT